MQLKYINFSPKPEVRQKKSAHFPKSSLRQSHQLCRKKPAFDAKSDISPSYLPRQYICQFNSYHGNTVNWDSSKIIWQYSSMLLKCFLLNLSYFSTTLVNNCSCRLFLIRGSVIPLTGSRRGGTAIPPNPTNLMPLSHSFGFFIPNPLSRPSHPPSALFLRRVRRTKMLDSWSSPASWRFTPKFIITRPVHVPEIISPPLRQTQHGFPSGLQNLNMCEMGVFPVRNSWVTFSSEKSSPGLAVQIPDHPVSFRNPTP
jgi:hypothetical protein